MCYKWRVKRTGDVVLRERPVQDQHLVRAAPDSVLLQSPGFNRRNQHYMNSMFCLYNITIHNCESITVRSTSGDHSLFVALNTPVQDYLFLDYGRSESPNTLYGSEVGHYSASVYTSSFYAILWSDSTRFTSSGAFELVATCGDDSTVHNTVDGTK